MKKDFTFGYDSNGEPIDESTVDELYRIAEHEILPETKLCQIGYATISDDSFEFYFSGGTYGALLKYDIDLDTDNEHIDLMKYIKRNAGFYPDFRSNKYTAKINFIIHIDNLNTFDVELSEADVYEEDTHSTYFTDRFNDYIDTERLCDAIREIAESAVREIHCTLSNL